ncbi:hypothetical protein LTR85_011899 [Meristemomyces frigidus]|nr:hypothetical protein LTR85_011899 [Meristemomyces frigidus]
MAELAAATDGVGTMTLATTSTTYDNASTMSAAAKVFGTYELVEHILSNTTTICAVRGRAVNHFWKDVIDGSITMQEKLFLSPSPRRPVLERVWDLDAYDYRLFVNYDPGAGNANKQVDILRMHPLMQPFAPEVRVWAKSRVDIKVDAMRLLRLPDGPWKRMLISQPPVKEMRVHCWLSEGTPGGAHMHQYEGTIRHASGIDYHAVIAECHAALHNFNMTRTCGHYEGDGCGKRGLLFLPGGLESRRKRTWRQWSRMSSFIGRMKRRCWLK